MDVHNVEQYKRRTFWLDLPESTSLKDVIGILNDMQIGFEGEKEELIKKMPNSHHLFKEGENNG